MESETISSVASALDAAYNRPPLQGGDPLRLIHRDIKPSNIMVTVEADVKVLDFGTAQAKFEDREAETQALAFGSAAYMSPERFLGDEDRLSGDVYALGVTLYELLYQGRYGKANVRQEKYYEEQERRFEKLDLVDFEPHIANRIQDLLRGMLKWEESERPSLAHILQETEELAQEINDGSLKLFCRNVVEKCKASLEKPDAKPDPLENEVLFEDGSESFADNVDSIVEQDPDIQSSISFPPPLSVASVKEEIPEPPLPSTVPTLDLEPSKADLSDTLKVNDSDVQKAKQSSSASMPKPKALPPKSGPTKNSNSVPLIMGGGLFLLLLGGGLGYWYINKDQSVKPVSTTIVETKTLPIGNPANEEDLGSDTGTKVVLKTTDSGKLFISLKQKNFEYDWNGEGQMVLNNVPNGKLRAKISQKGNDKDLRSQIVIGKNQEGKECTYTLQLTQSNADWSEECSG